MCQATSVTSPQPVAAVRSERMPWAGSQARLMAKITTRICPNQKIGIE